MGGWGEQNESNPRARAFDFASHASPLSAASPGVPVGCLLVPKRHMGVVAPALAKQGRATDGASWLRKFGIVQHSNVGEFLIHLTVPGAAVFSSDDELVVSPAQYIE